MSRLTTAFLIATLASSASAGDIYNGFARGNFDLYPHNLSVDSSAYGSAAAPRIGVQPGVGDIGSNASSPGSRAGAYAHSEPFRHYHDWARGNSDLYPENIAGTRTRDYLRTGMQPGVGDTGTGSRYYVSLAPPPVDKPFTPTIETFGQ